MDAVKVVVYGLSTEGYAIACQMAIRGADVCIIDESTTSAIQISAEIARTYPDVSAFKEDEPILPMEPINVAISKARYLFFTPLIRQTGQDIKIEISSKFKDATTSLKKNSSVIFSLPTRLGGNSETITLLEHVTGFEVGKSISYFYYPLNDQSRQPRFIGSFNGKKDEVLSGLLAGGKKEKKFVTITSSENFHAIDILTGFSNLCSILEISKHVPNETTRNDMTADGFGDMFLDEMVSGLFDLKILTSSLERTNTLMYLINGGTKGIDGYIKRLTDEIRAILKRNEIKASRTKVVLCWALDRYAMRGDKIEIRQMLASRLRDYIGDVEMHAEHDLDMFHTDKITIFVVCTKPDLENALKIEKSPTLMIVQANPMCDIVQ